MELHQQVLCTRKRSLVIGLRGVEVVSLFGVRLDASCLHHTFGRVFRGHRRDALNRLLIHLSGLLQPLDGAVRLVVVKFLLGLELLHGWLAVLLVALMCVRIVAEIA